MDKIETKNLLKNHTCDSCKWLQYDVYKKEYCFSQFIYKKKRLPIPSSRTCEFWQNPNDKYLKFSLANKDEVKDFFTNGKVFNINHYENIEGIELYYAPTREKIWEQNFPDGPYEFPVNGGTLKIDVSDIKDATMKNIIMGL